MAKKDKKNTRIEKREITKSFWIPLTSKEKEDYGARAGRVHSKGLKLKTKNDDKRKEMKAEEKLCDVEVAELLQALEKGAVFVEKKVTEVRDFDKGVIRWVEGKKVIDECEMVDHDNQTDLLDGTAKRAKKIDNKKDLVDKKKAVVDKKKTQTKKDKAATKNARAVASALANQ